MGKVYLIGAGPGNEELVTLKAIRVLKECTAVLYDRLAGGNLLKYLNKDCKIFYCGKEPGCHYKSQEEINHMLVELGKQGHIIGRIKGGDPYVFGRGGEEALELLKEGITFEVIPGVTSAISVLSYAGIPVTHRGLSQSFHVFTGMSAEKLNINWQAVAGLNGTLIFLMGLENIEKITAYLLQQGKTKETPCAVVMRGTTSKQKAVKGNLENIAEKAREAGLKSPCIIVIGEVVSLKDSLNWYEKLPLFGLNVCVTRAKEQAAELSEALTKLGAEVTEINAISIKNTAYNLDPYLDKLKNFDYIVLSSINSVNIFFEYLKEKQIDIRTLQGKFAVIGPATKNALQDRGIMAAITAEEFVGEGLSEILKNVVKAHESVFIPGSKVSRRVIPETLKQSGCEVTEVAIYDTEASELVNPKAFEEVDIVLLTSPSGVKNLIDMVGITALKAKTNIAIGPITYKALEQNGVEAYVSEIYSTQGMIDLLIKIKESEISASKK